MKLFQHSESARKLIFVVLKIQKSAAFWMTFFDRKTDNVIAEGTRIVLRCRLNRTSGAERVHISDAWVFNLGESFNKLPVDFVQRVGTRDLKMNYETAM